MDCRESLRILRDELLRRGLPRRYVKRVTGELADHADDVAAEARYTTPATDPSTPPPQPAQRLGDPMRLADGITRAFQRRTFLGRHPWFTFVTLPAGAMIAAWVATFLLIELLVVLLLWIGGETPGGAWHWAAAVLAGTLAYGWTYGFPALVCWWALRKARQTARAAAWVWAATTVLVLTTCVFRIYVFRTADGRFGLDSSWLFRCLINVLAYGHVLPPGWTWWRLLRAEGLFLGYLAQVAVLIGATALAIRQSRRAAAARLSTELAERGEVA